jgi:hypothetical protein
MEDIVELIRAHFKYDPEKGTLTRVGSHSPRHRKSLPMEIELRKDRYSTAMVGGKEMVVHRLVWTYMTGEIPGPEWRIDHKDRDISNIKWENLRKVPHGANVRNQEQQRKPRGTTGVYFIKAKAHMRKPWAAMIRIDKQLKLLGYFETQEEAARVRAAAHDAEMARIEEQFEGKVTTKEEA